MAEKRFPNESAEYRKARNFLLQAEIALRAQAEKVSQERRALPDGGEIPEDYEFERLGSDGEIETVCMSALFEDDKNSLLVYSYMYGPDMERPCPMCTSMLDALNGNASQIRERINLAVVARSPIPRVAEFAHDRGWRQLPLLSSFNNSYHRDYFGETGEGNQMPMANVFVRDGGVVRHFWGSELLYAAVDGQPRHVDMLWPLWNAFDLTPDGRGTDWYPSL